MNHDTFLTELLTQAEHPQDEIELIIENARPVLYERVMTHIANKLTDQQLDEANKLFTNNADEQTVYDFLSSRIDDYDTFIQKVYNDFADMYLQEYNEK